MKNIFLLMLTAALALGTTAQDKVINDPNAEKRTVSGFHSISVSGGIDLILTQGSDEAVAVSGSKKEYVEKIRTVVENGVLKIYYDNNNWFGWNGGNRKLRAYVSVKTLQALTGSGGSDIDINGTLSVPKLNLDLSGGSDFKGAVNTTDLDIDVSGGSDADISGKATNVTIDASGGSDVDAYSLTAENCNASASGGGDITISVNKELSASASGGGDIHYKGNPSIKKNSSSGGGSVSKRG